MWCQRPDRRFGAAAAVDRNVRLLPATDLRIGLPGPIKFAFVVERIRASFPSRDGDEEATEEPPSYAAEALRSWLDARVTDHVTLGEAATELDIGITTLARAFARDTGR